jgi:diaminopimelate epimerase
MGIKFTKMHGLGNDFMVIDGINQDINLNKSDILKLSNRSTGIGFDQCLLIEASHSSGVDFIYRIFNADGQEVGQCGNGARCLARFAYHYGLTKKKELIVATKTTQMKLTINMDETVSVDMGIPKSNPTAIPFLAAQQSTLYELPIKEEQTVAIHIVNVGNPHAVLVVDHLKSAPVHELGQHISVHSSFPEQTNVGFMRIVDSQHIQLRVYERGCGETNACGSGAVAAAAVGRLYYNLAERVTVSLLGGDLTVEWPDKNQGITLTGSATFIYEGILLC